MTIELYVDILFLINFLMVYFIFFITNKLTKTKASKKRLCLGAFVASFLYVLTVSFIPFYKFLSFFIICAIFIFSIIICFKPYNVKHFFKLFFLVNTIAFCIGGFSIALFYYTKFGYYFSLTLKHFPVKILLLSTVTTYICIKIFLVWYKKIVVKKQSFYKITLHKDNQKITLNALLDTGNNLTEPITKKPVIVADFNAIKSILPEQLKLIFYNNQQDNLEKLLTLQHTVHLRLIPFKSIGKQNGLLIGTKIDKLKIHTQNDLIITDAIVAISNFNLSNDNFYNALLNPELLKN